MIIILAPTKNQNFKPSTLLTEFSLPHFRKEATVLIELLRQLSQQELSELLSINRELTQLNTDRLFQWKLPFTPENAKQTVLAFDGEVFRGLHATELTDADYQYAQHHLFILSGLYGVLRPLDLIQPYRLEVSSRLNNPAGRDLYPYWQEKVSQFLRKQFRADKENSAIINLSSAEYSKMVDFAVFKRPVINPEFYQEKGNELKQIVIYTKRARGLMAGFILKNQLKNPDDLKAFNEEGYAFHPILSTEDRPVFVR